MTEEEALEICVLLKDVVGDVDAVLETLLVALMLCDVLTVVLCVVVMVDNWVQSRKRPSECVSNRFVNASDVLSHKELSLCINPPTVQVKLETSFGENTKLDIILFNADTTCTQLLTSRNTSKLFSFIVSQVRVADACPVHCRSALLSNSACLIQFVPAPRYVLLENSTQETPPFQVVLTVVEGDEYPHSEKSSRTKLSKI